MNRWKFEKEVIELLERIAKAVEKAAPPGPGHAVDFIFVLKGDSMKAGQLVKVVSLVGKKSTAQAAAGTPTQLSDSAPQAIAVVGIDAAGVFGAQLAPGASIAITAGPGAVGTPGTFSPDPTPALVNFVDANGTAHTNVPSVASGSFVPSPAPNADVNDPFPISYAITGGSGDSGSAQFETAVGVETSEVIVLPTANPASKASPIQGR